jgi:hypothetical protein
MAFTAEKLRQLQSVQNAAARLIFGLRRTNHLTDALICLHLLHVTERIQFKLAMLTYRALYGNVPSHLCTVTLVSSLPPGRRFLQSADSLQLVIPRTHLSTIGDRAFPVAGAHIWWNGLPAYVTSSPSLCMFRAILKTHLFSISFPGVLVPCY